MIGFCTLNLGCKVNRVEMDGFERICQEAGLVRCDATQADIIIVNTCTVTGEAEKKARKLVRGAIRANGHADIIVTGCASAMAPDVFADMSDRVDVVAKAEMGDHLKERLSDLSPRSDTLPCQYEPDRSRVGVKIQDGCDNSCSYCIVCKARGRSHSVDVDSIHESVDRLINAGIREIILTGIDIGAYRGNDGDLTDLLSSLIDRTKADLDENGRPCRFRISSIEPVNVDDRLIELIAGANGRICRHLHIPLQSGSDKVLREMGRHYDCGEYLALVERLMSSVPNISITTDVIVGFPGESDEDFKDTLDLARQCAFSNMHIFPYSKREGTVAAKRADQVPSEVKAFRARTLRKLARDLRLEDALSRVGSREVYCIQEDGMMTSESYFEAPSIEGACASRLIEADFTCVELLCDPSLLECDHDG